MNDDNTAVEAPESAPGLPPGVIDDLTTSMPEMQPHAVDAEQESMETVGEMESAEPVSLTAAVVENGDALVDSDGNPFNPEIHAVDAEGNPKISSRGKLQKKRGRKKKVEGVESSEEMLAKQQAALSGLVAASALINVGVVVGGEEWLPRADPATGLNEKDMLSAAFGDYFLATGQADLPPGVALSVAVMGYMLPRFAMPKTQTRIKRFKEWSVGKWTLWRAKRNRNKIAKAVAKDDNAGELEA